MSKDEARVVVREAAVVSNGPNPTGFQSAEAAAAASAVDDDEEGPQPGIRLAAVPVRAKEAREGARVFDPMKLVKVRLFKALPRMIVGEVMYSFEAGKDYHAPRHVRDLLTEKGYC